MRSMLVFHVTLGLAYDPPDDQDRVAEMIRELLTDDTALFAGVEVLAMGTTEEIRKEDTQKINLLREARVLLNQGGSVTAYGKDRLRTIVEQVMRMEGL